MSKNIIIEPLTMDDSHMAFDLASRVFHASSPIHQCLSISLETYQDFLWPSFKFMVRENLSFIAKEPVADKIIGCMIITDFISSFGAKSKTPEAFEPFQALTSALRAEYPTQARTLKGHSILIDMAAVHPNFEGFGIYQRLRADAQMHAQKRGFRYVIGELSSAATQHVVLKRLGHTKRADIPFASFEHKGDRPFQTIKTPPSFVLCEGKL